MGETNLIKRENWAGKFNLGKEANDKKKREIAKGQNVKIKVKNIVCLKLIKCLEKVFKMKPHLLALKT